MSDLAAREAELLRFVRVFAELNQSLPVRREEERAAWAHSCFEAMLLAVGRLWRPQAFPPIDTRWREPKACFRNAIHLAMEAGLAYCEGYAHSGIIVTPHAWCLDAKGRVVDPTWAGETIMGQRRSGDAYLGIAFETRWVVATLAKQKTYGVLWESDAGFKMVTGGVPPERLAAIHRQGRVPKWAKG